MLLLPQKGTDRVITNGGIVGTGDPGTGIPSHATTANSYGTLTEVISSGTNNQDSWGFAIWITETGASATASEASLDVYIGGATDDLLIKALICGGGAPGQGGHLYYFPLHTPPGKRIACQLASVRTGITARVVIWLYGGGVPPHRVGSRVTTYGTQINNSRGQAVTPTANGGAASVTQMTATSTYDHFAFLPGFQVAVDSNWGAATTYNTGIGVGASTEERIGTWWYHTANSETMTGPMPHIPAYRDVPASTRLTLLSSNGLAANESDYDGLIYAVT